MKPEELMIGDWVFNTHHKKNIKIIPYDFFTHGHEKSGVQYLTSNSKPVTGQDFEPILITPEILEKNGFELKPDGYLLAIDGTEQNYVFVQFRHKLECRRIEIRTRRHSYTSNEILYLHELQHALRLCKINKKIKL